MKIELVKKGDPRLKEVCEEITDFENKEFLKSAFTFNEMLKITKRELNYMSSPICWSGLSHDYLSMCYYELKDYRKALEQVEIAISFSPTDNRLLSNRKIFIDLFNSSNQ